MKIIKNGNDNWKEKKLSGKKKCSRCKCKFIYDSKDTYKALSVMNIQHYYVNCPYCKRSIEICSVN